MDIVETQLDIPTMVTIRLFRISVCVCACVCVCVCVCVVYCGKDNSIFRV